MSVKSRRNLLQYFLQRILLLHIPYIYFVKYVSWRPAPVVKALDNCPPCRSTVKSTHCSDCVTVYNRTISSWSTSASHALICCRWMMSSSNIARLSVAVTRTLHQRYCVECLTFLRSLMYGAWASYSMSWQDILFMSGRLHLNCMPPILLC